MQATGDDEVVVRADGRELRVDG
ncbi:MAG: hypothetical protein QOJ21_3599, partial [Solirubrobacteraceae bacterium]|nr:hypothetical protein [Solirubrobacteraceae bacterium]